MTIAAIVNLTIGFIGLIIGILLCIYSYRNGEGKGKCISIGIRIAFLAVIMLMYVYSLNF